MVSNASVPDGRVKVYRHSLLVRVSHWLNVLCMSILLLSGLQIFNAHRELYWGQYGADNDPSFISMQAVEKDGVQRGVTQVGPLTFDTTGLLGLSKVDGEETERGFPSWATLPSYQDLAAGRRWHFFFAWLFVINGFVYLLYGIASRHLRSDLVPASAELAPGHLLQEVKDHARLRFPKGQSARRYNTLQKLAYLAVIFVLLPMMIATGLTMSPGFNAVAPFLLDVFGGRQSARTLHFLSAFGLVAFVVVHVVMVLVSGVFNNMRSMITGYYAIEGDKP
jgi:thiosulfate reductase cytochrome b subunit